MSIDFGVKPRELPADYADCVLAIGARASSLLLVDGKGMDLDKIGKECPNLRTIQVKKYTSVANMRALFAIPKMKLVKLDVMVLVNENAIMPIFSDKVSTLEHFEYTGILPFVDVFSQLVAGNPGLKTVKLRSVYILESDCCSSAKDSSAGQWFADRLGTTAPRSNVISWGPLLIAFLQGPSLTELEFNCTRSQGKRGKCSRLADLTLPARVKGISIAICGVRYEGYADSPFISWRSFPSWVADLIR